jgi:hypothetical protein
MRHTLRKRRTYRKRRSFSKKRVTRKQSGGRINMDKLDRIINNRFNAASKAGYSAKIAEELQEHINSL